MYSAGVALHPLADKFWAVADSYERGRPEYQPAVIDALAAELPIGPGATVLDLAAGTGKLTRALIAAELDVVAVEPQAPLRDLLVAHVGAQRVLDGLAEAIPLPDASVDAVTVADAFHWFDQNAALAEIHRVLRPGGGLALLSSTPDWSGASWAHEVGALMQSLRPAHPKFDGPPWQDAVRAAGDWTEPREINLTTTQPTDAARMVDYIASVSWFASMSEERRAEVMEEVTALVAAGETPAEMQVYVTIGLTARA